MHRFALLALVAGSLVPGAVHAQAVPDTQQGYAFCSVTDTSRAQATIWASPVVPVTFGADDPGGFRRGMDLAGEFLAHVGTLGGQGNKMCSVTASQDEARALREEQRSIWDKRLYFVKIGEWREVAWTPAAYAPATRLANTAPVMRHFLCQATQVDIPDRSDRSRTVTSGVFAMPVSGTDALQAMHAQASAYSAEFQSVVEAHGLPVQGSCTPYDTANEAQHAYQQLVRLFKGFNMKYTEVAWRPTGRPVAAATVTTPAAIAAPPATKGRLGVRIDAISPELAQGLGLPSTQGAWIVEVVPGSVAMRAGIKPMDVVLDIAGQTVVAPADLPAAVGRLQPGVEAPLRIWRDRQAHTLTITLPPADVATPDTGTTTPTARTDHHYYCSAQVSTTHPTPLVLHAPLREFPGTPTGTATLATTLTALLGSVKTSNPVWIDFEPVACYPNGEVFPGEVFCVASAHKRLRKLSQVGAMFCNASREQAERRWQDIEQAGGAVARPLAWP
ncbi:PDZ domain-containing protein [Pseudoxanthomonas sp.]|uniref:S1C family serine protease n=1 Tax=Pseudoxanthomonas sp. TaxID=1871049 RepID=UPI002FE272DB